MRLPHRSITSTGVMDSGLDAAHRPGMTKDNPTCQTASHAPAFSRRVASEFCFVLPPSLNRGRRENRVPIAPMVPVQKKHGRQNHRLNRITPVFPAQWLYGLLRTLPGDRAFLPPSPPGSGASQGLDTSVGAPGPYDFAVRHSHARLARHSVHRILFPTFVTIAKRPSCGNRTGRKCD